MITVIAGSRKLKLPEYVRDAVIESGFDITEVRVGDAIGIDDVAYAWAYERDIPVSVYKADWETYGKRAGYLRNLQMAEGSDALIAIWDGKSLGTMHMINIAKKKGMRLYVKRV